MITDLIAKGSDVKSGTKDKNRDVGALSGNVAAGERHAYKKLRYE